MTITRAEPESDVLVIGAGAAGLATAAELGRRGLRIALIEARDRIGGRIHSLHDPRLHCAVELGAEFIHGLPGETWQIVRAAGLMPCEVADEHWQLKAGRLQRIDDIWDQVDRILGRLKGAGDISFDAFAATCCSAEDAAALALARAYVEGINAADANKISTRALAETQEAEQQIQADRLFRLPGGYGELAKWLEDQVMRGSVRVHLSSVVRTITWKPGGVEVLAAANGGAAATFRARTAVITLPLGVLQAAAPAPGAVQFIPELPLKQDALSRLEMGAALRLVLRFQQAFWETEPLPTLQGLDALDLSFLHATDPRQAPFFTWWSLRPLHAPVLVGWSGGPAAARLSALKQTELLDQAMQSLSQFFGIGPADLQRKLADAWVTNWCIDPYARGAYSYVPVGGSGAMRALAQPIAGTLFFAGEATYSGGLQGTVAGALSTGQRAAHELMSALGVRP